MLAGLMLAGVIAIVVLMSFSRGTSVRSSHVLYRGVKSLTVRVSLSTQLGLPASWIGFRPGLPTPRSRK